MKKGRVIVVKSRLVPRRFTVNVFGTLWTRDPKRITPRIVNHERIHTAQMRELLFVAFYAVYFIEWLVRLAQYGNWYEAYKNISFEREAYGNDVNERYLSERRPYEWARRYMALRKG